MGYRSRQSYWTPRRRRRFWRQYERLSGQARAGLLDNDVIAPRGGGVLTPEERAQVPVPFGCCWNCHRLPHGLFACIYCGAEQPVGQWRFPPICWPAFDENDAVLAFGTVGFIYGRHWLDYEFALAEPDTTRRREIAESIARDPTAKRQANQDLLQQAVQNLLQHWQEKFGHAAS